MGTEGYYNSNKQRGVPIFSKKKKESDGRKSSLWRPTLAKKERKDPSLKGKSDPFPQRKKKENRAYP